MTEHELKTLQYYDRQAKEFQESVSSADMSEACDRFLKYFDRPVHILDLGCGTGRDSKYFINQGHSVVPADGSEEMCKIASKVTGAQARRLKFDELDYTEEFDGVWACASLLHVEREKLPEIISKINKALKIGGIFYMSFKYGKNSEERNGRYFTDMTEADVPFLCKEENGFKVLECYITEDVRPKRNNEKWLNIIAKKEGERN